MPIRSADQDMKSDGQKWSRAISSIPVVRDMAKAVTGRRRPGIKNDVGSNIMPKKMA